MSIRHLSTFETQELKALHEDFGHEACLSGCSTAAAAFLLVGALIVITCGSLCSMLPGINVTSHIILRAVVPGLCAIVLSIPFIILSVYKSRDANALREKMITRALTLMDEYEIPEKKEEERIEFMLHNFLDWRSNAKKPSEIDKNTHWGFYYQKEILKDIKEKMGKEKNDRNPRQEKIAEAIEKAITRLQEKKKK